MWEENMRKVVLGWKIKFLSKYILIILMWEENIGKGITKL